MLLLAMSALAVSCGKPGTHLASPAGTRACLAKVGVRFGGPLDFVATTATGGALKAHLRGNGVTIVFGETVPDADNINDAYHRFHARNIGIDDVLRQQGNAVMLWNSHPSNEDLARVDDCLK